jgi:ribonucleotide reductase alpha subunit
MMRELIEIGVWSNELKDNIILNKGSIQHLTCVPQFIKDKYKIVWEIPMKHMIDMAADRGAYICQSQSLNLWLEDPDYKSLTSMHFYAWKKKLKTGIYYLRRKARHQPQQFTIGPEKTKNGEENDNNPDNDNIIDETEMCEMCSS